VTDGSSTKLQEAIQNLPEEIKVRVPYNALPLLEISEFKDNIEKIVNEQSPDTLIKYYNYLFPRVFEYKNMLECLNFMKMKAEEPILQELLNNS
jgi:hypothetical protein